MTINIQHARDAVMGWGITVNVSAGGAETIAAVRIEVNGFPQAEESFSAPLISYAKQLHQQGVYPGDNKVLVSVTDAAGRVSSGLDSWS